MDNREAVEQSLNHVKDLASSKEGGELAVALAEVIKVITRWREGDDIILIPQKAADEILCAIEKGLYG